MRYAQHFNWKYSQSGHLWQGRFYSCALDESHTLAATRYVEYNPVRAGFAGLPWVYKWSSARAHIGETRDKLLSKIWPPQDLASEWREFLMHPEDKEKIEEIRASTRRGRPLGSSDFVATLERLLGRNLTARKRGRPRKRS
jgi:putative transposase